MELNDNDRQRIGKEVQRMLEEGVSNVKRGLWDIAMYATIYEREQQAKEIKPELWTLSKWGDSDVLMCNGVISGVSIEEIANKLNHLSQLEAERTELRNKVIEECIAAIKPMKNGFNYNQIDADDAIQYLNSLKTK